MRFSFNFWFGTFCLVLFGASVFFTAEVIGFKSALKPSPDKIEIKSGQDVEILEIIDGDEVSSLLGGKKIVIRILGIYSFDSTVNDQSIQVAAKSAYLFLENTLKGRKARVIFDEFKIDRQGRLLAYLEKDGRDIGKEMVASGFSLVYEKYSFSRQKEYLAAEEDAIKNKRGLWGEKVAALRSQKLKKKWNSERNE